MAPALRLRGLILIAALASAGAAAAQAPPHAPDPCNAPPNRNEPDLIEGLGCATQTNLRAMIADPAELARGARPTPPRGDAALLAAHRHRLGQAKRIVDEESGGGGQSTPNSSSR